MKRTLAIVAALGLSAVVSGCLFSSNDGTSVEAQSQVSPAWKVMLQSKCEGENHDTCVGAYGFSVTTDGQYQIGPAPGGQIVRGSLSHEELKAVADPISNLATSESAPSPASATAPTCQSLSQGDSEDTLTLTRTGKDIPVARTVGSELCFQSANVTAATALHKAVRALAEKYYALPFPNPCSEAVSSLKHLYSTVQTCSSDADCVYVSESFEAIPPSSEQYVLTDNCSQAKPLTVANYKTISSQRDALISAFNATLQACGEAANYCGGFASGVGAPSCQQGVCRISAAARQ